MNQREAMQAAFDHLGERFFRAAEECARRQYGEARNGQGIAAVAVEHMVRPIELLALFGFLLHYRAPRYVDMLQEGNADDMGVLPKGDFRTALAYALSQAVSDDAGLTFVVE